MYEDLASLLKVQMGVEGSGDELSDLLALVPLVGLNSQEIQEDLIALVRQRIVLWCAGDVMRDMNFRERERGLAARLRSVTGSPAGWKPHTDLVRLLARLASRFGNAGVGPRDSMDTIDSTTRRELLTTQGSRCAVCGVALTTSVVRACKIFPSGVEPVFTATLEHIEPFSLVGNKTDFEVLCAPCNGIKRDRLAWHEDGRVVAGNLPLASIHRPLMTRMHFWTLYRGRRCDHRNCETTSRDALLFVEATTQSPGTFGALRVACIEHVASGTEWIHMHVARGMLPTSDDD